MPEITTKTTPTYKKNHFRKLHIILKTLKNGSTIAKACRAAGIYRSTLYNLWYRRYPRLKTLVNNIRDSKLVSVEDALYAKALKGNVKAQMFFLCNRDPDRWKSKDGNIQIVKVVSASRYEGVPKEDLNAIADSISKRRQGIKS